MVWIEHTMPAFLEMFQHLMQLIPQIVDLQSKTVDLIREIVHSRRKAGSVYIIRDIISTALKGPRCIRRTSYDVSRRAPVLLSIAIIDVDMRVTNVLLRPNVRTKCVGVKWDGGYRP